MRSMRAAERLPRGAPHWGQDGWRSHADTGAALHDDNGGQAQGQAREGDTASESNGAPTEGGLVDANLEADLDDLDAGGLVVEDASGGRCGRDGFDDLDGSLVDEAKPRRGAPPRLRVHHEAEEEW